MLWTVVWTTLCKFKRKRK